jgi:hypothetical protein
VLVAFMPFHAAGSAGLVAATAAAGFVLGWAVLGRRLEAAGRARTERLARVHVAGRASSQPERS